ncbi:MAG: DNA polymerase IV [Lachnospiraceae bacterium]|nr:DNA polymerase IV [Lachnospiraceae bacterium]MBQ9609408.1 DNA polymerase IV [Lachnospiraceae bacterium]
MDAFYASVEIRDNPTLKGKPLIIGSMPNERGVVATCSYEARRFGVHSGMNIKEAYRLCPSGIYMHPNFDKYKKVSLKLHDIWNTYSTASEYIALDEAYLDVTEKAIDWDGARKIAETIKRRTGDEVGLTCSVGVAYSKTAAKTASEEKKPDGYFEILDADEFVNLLSDRDVQALYTVGPKTAEKLKAHGIFTVRDIRSNQETVKHLLGKQGVWITEIANGIDNRKVIPYRPEDAKSISRELTFQEDVSDFDFVKEVMLLLAMSVEERAKRVGLHGKGVSIKITYYDMRSVTRSKSPVRCESAIEIYNEAVQLLAQVDSERIRLIGVGIYNLYGNVGRQLSFEDIFDEFKLSYDKELNEKLEEIGKRYDLDFIGNKVQLYNLETLHRTVEYMRKHR